MSELAADSDDIKAALTSAVAYTHFLGEEDWVPVLLGAKACGGKVVLLTDSRREDGALLVWVYKAGRPSRVRPETLDVGTPEQAMAIYMSKVGSL